MASAESGARRPLPRLIGLQLLAVALTLAGAGCAVGPEFKRPPPPTAGRYTQAPMASLLPGQVGDQQRLIEGGDIPGQWWALFHSQPLNDLIEEALKSNADLRAAEAALRVAQENGRAQQGAFYPSLDASFQSSRNMNPEATLSSPLASGGSIYNLHTAQLSVSYAPDVFGGLRRSVESLQAQAAQQRFLMQAVYVSLTSNVVNAAVQEASLRDQIAVTGRLIDSAQQVLTILQRERDLGAASATDVTTQEAALAQFKASLPPLEKQLAQQRDLLAALTGRLPSDDVAARFELDSLKLPKDLPLSLPSKLVDQRPDVRAAEENLHSASAQIGVATANRLPNITLSGVGGSTALEIGQLFTPGAGFWSLTAGITQPVFQGGALLHRQRAAEAAYDQAAAQYRSSVVGAFQNVADTLHALHADADAYVADIAAEQAAATNLRTARRQLELGDISPLTLRLAEQTYGQAQLTRIQAQANRFADTAALFQALGGGWWNTEKPAN